MFKIVRSTPNTAELDLATMRETLRYIQGEIARVPSLAGAAAAISTAIIEMEQAEARSRQALRPQGFTQSRFHRVRH